ncbi:MAG TPA: thioredoxin family protein [Flavobacteriales bacterium]|nr:thioredoxin family protein [Flavobacteriales bacterium]
MVNDNMNVLNPPRKGAVGIACALALGFFMTSAGIAEPQPELAIGSKAPLAEGLMMNVNGKEMSLNSAAGPNGLLVVFSCNTCPFVVGNGMKSDGWEGRYNETASFAKENGVAMVLVNSNEAKRDNHDSMEAMKAHAKENKYGMPYLLDSNHELADAFGALKTPHVYLFNGDMTLVYRGSIDNNVSDAEAVTEHYVKDAIAALAKGKTIAVSETKAIGCSIKRVSK